MALNMLLFTVICSNRTWAANWAQSSGAIEQNLVFPYIPSPATKHWGPRYGMTTVSIEGVSSCMFFRMFMQIFINTYPQIYLRAGSIISLIYKLAG